MLGLPTLLYPFGRDQAMFAYVGQVWREGGLPYRDAWDVKLPGVYAVYALVGGAEWGPRLLDLFAVAATAVALGLLARRLPAPRNSGVLAAAVAGWYTLGAFDFWNLAQAETLIAPLTTAALAAAVYRRPFLAGALAGLAATFKTTAVLAVIPVMAAALLGSIHALPMKDDRQRFRAPAFPDPQLVRCALGWLAPPLLFVVYFAARDALPFLGELVATQSEYAGGDPRLAGRSAMELVQRLGLTGYLPLVGVSLIGLVSLCRRPWIDWEHRSSELIAVLWFLTALAQVTVQRRFYLYHWAVLTPPAAWIAAQYIAALWQSRPDAPAVRRAVRLGVLLTAALLLLAAVAPRWPSWRSAARVALGQSSIADFRAMHHGVFDFDPGRARKAGAWIQAHSQPNDALLVFGFEPELYLYSGRRAPTRHASDAPITGETSIRETRRRDWFDELMTDLRRKPPLYIVESTPPRPRPDWCRPFWDLLAADYQHETSYGPLPVYRRRRPSLNPEP
ncbi:MAG: hypothetical protein ACO1SX_14815 [Actinomycetota bacterium]